MDSDEVIYCAGCGNEIDPETCWCGGGKYHNPLYDGHSFVPMGCTCFYPRESDDV